MTDDLLKPEKRKVIEARTFFETFSSVILGSVTQAGLPHTSYAPHITDQGRIYIFVSSLAQHSVSLKTGNASLFLIENEKQARTIFARKRLTIQCSVAEIDSDHPDFVRLLDRLQQRHGSTVKLLRSLPDFILFELEPRTASFVTGFGAAFDLTPHLDELTNNRQ